MWSFRGGSEDPRPGTITRGFARDPGPPLAARNLRAIAWQLDSTGGSCLDEACVPLARTAHGLRLGAGPVRRTGGGADCGPRPVDQLSPVVSAARAPADGRV